jgi:hypothetical protein
MTTIASPSSGARPARRRRPLSAALLAAGIAAGALLQPAIAAAAPPVTPTPRPVPPGAPLHPALPSGPTGAGETGGGWDIETFDTCMAQRWGDGDYCCTISGGVVGPNHLCQAPPAQHAQ